MVRKLIAALVLLVADAPPPPLTRAQVASSASVPLLALARPPPVVTQVRAASEAATQRVTFGISATEKVDQEL